MVRDTDVKVLLVRGVIMSIVYQDKSLIDGNVRREPDMILTRRMSGGLV